MVPLLGLLFLAKLAVALWGVDRGFDLGDGGFFLLNLNRPGESAPLFEFYKLLALLDEPPHFDVVGSRLLRLATELAATLALAGGVFSWARVRFPNVRAAGFAHFLVFVLLGSLLTAGARGFGYNDATNLVTFCACAALFRLLSLPEAAAAARLRWGLAAGFALGFQLFVKFPPALLLAGTALLLAATVLRGSRRARLAVVAACGVGGALAVLLFVLANGGVSPLLAKWAEAREVNRVTGYDVGAILRVYYHHDFASHVNLLRFAVTFLSVFAIARAISGGGARARDRSLTAATLASGAVLAWGTASLHPVNVHPSLLFLYCLVLLLAAAFWILARTGWRPPPGAPEQTRWETFAPLLLLLALPFFDIMGTNVALTLRLPTHVAPIFALLALLWTDLRPRAGHRWFCRVTLAMLVGVTAVAFVQHHVLRPYGLARPLYRQTEPAPHLPGLKVDRATRVFLAELHTALDEAGFRPGDPLVALDFMPGLVYYLEARSPGYLLFHWDMIPLNCWALERADLAEPPYLILGQPMAVEQHACIQAFRYPEDFRRVATLANPYEDAYPYFFGANPLPYVHVFAPRERPPPPPAAQKEKPSSSARRSASSAGPDAPASR